MDAMLEKKKADIHVPFEQATEYLKEITATEEHVFPSTGLGSDLRFESPGMVGSALVFENVPVHVAFFSLAESEPGARDDTGMSGYKKRKSYRGPRDAAYWEMISRLQRES
jgi:hypothetical protein